MFSPLKEIEARIDALLIILHKTESDPADLPAEVLEANLALIGEELEQIRDDVSDMADELEERIDDLQELL